MITIASTLSPLSLIALFASGCGSTSESAFTAPPSADSNGYGYEFPADHVSSTSPAPHRALAAMENGRLAPEVIQDTVRQAFPAISACYEAGLAKDATLAGQMTLRFVIGGDGHITEIASRDSSLSDDEVARCVVKSVSAIEFPRRDRAVVTVVYPLAFAR